MAAAVSYVLLAAHARGLAGYWRAGGPAHAGGPRGGGRAGDERVLALIHLGHARQDKEPPARLPTGDYIAFLP